MLSAICKAPGVVLAGALCNLCSMFVKTGYVPIVPSLGFDSHQIGQLLSVQGFAGCLALVPAGLAVDTCGGEPLLRLSITFMTAGVVLTSVSEDFVVQFCARTIIGVAGSVSFNAGMAIIMTNFRAEKRSEYIGVSLGLSTIGTLVGPLLAGHIFTTARRCELPQPLCWAFCPAYILLALSYYMVRPSQKTALEAALLQAGGSGSGQPDNDGGDDEDMETVLSPGTESLTNPQCCQHEGILQKVCCLFFSVYIAVGHRAVVLAMVLVFIFGANSAAVCAAALEMHRIGLTADKIAIAYFPAALMQVIVNPWAGRISGQATRRELLMICSPFLLSFMMAVAASLRGMGGDAALLSLVLTIVSTSTAVALTDSPSISMMGDLAAAKGRGYGQAVTASELAVTAGFGAGPSVAVYFLQVSGVVGLLIALAGGAAAIGAASGLTLRNIPHHRSSSNLLGECEQASPTARA
eukprot:TRINITY_DN51873_c0_g1_i1.p1 TRINITY_DN51873_c0_g1~~TRINITY_DN51873_c0_g1_i1.p1  ORF type:complete len:466 (+),score=46.66 TRINITY_DN51873_c0_g1_i1:152-1549(+)